MFKHELGCEVKTKVSSFIGVIVSRSECLYGCNRYYIQPKISKDGKLPEAYWFDEDDIVVTKQKVVKSASKSGGLPNRNS